MKRPHSGDYGNDSSSKRRRDDFKDSHFVQNNLKKLIVRAGDDLDPVHFKRASDAISMEAIDQPDFIIETIYTCVTELPYKVQGYGILVGCLNATSPGLVMGILSTALEKLLLSLEDVNFMRSTLLLQFVAILPSVGILHPLNVLEFLNPLTYMLSDPDASQGHLDTLCYVVLQALPWVAPYCLGAEDSADLLQKLMAEIKEYMIRRRGVYDRKLAVLTDLHLMGDEDDETIPLDQVEELWSAVQSVADNGWTVASIPVISPEIRKLWQDADRRRLECPDAINFDSRAACPSFAMTFSLFDRYDEKEDGGEIRRIDRIAVHWTVMHTADAFFPEAAEAAKRISMIRVGVPCERLVVEGLIRLILQLPQPSKKSIYYSIVFVNLCKTDKAIANYAPAVGKAFALLFEKAAVLDVTAWDRFTTHFALHLSNFGWKWPWAKWAHVLDAPRDDPQRVMLTDMLQRCETLSYLEKLRDSVPEDLRELLPAKVELINPYAGSEGDVEINDLESEEPSRTTRQICDGLVDKMKNVEKNSSVVLAWLDNVVPSSSRGVAPGLKASLIITALLLCGSNTMSYLRTLMQSYLPVLQKVVASHADRLAVIVSIMSVVGSFPLLVVWMIGKLQAINVLDAPAVIDWIFSVDNIPQFNRFFVWHILDDVLFRLDAGEKAAREQAERARMEGSLDEESAVALERKEALERKLEGIVAQTRASYSILLQRFHDVLREHLLRCDEAGSSHGTPWFYATVGRLRAFGRTHRLVLRDIKDVVLELKLGESDARIAFAFKEIEADMMG